MAKLYRLVPDAIATLCIEGYLSPITEDMFYKLNYMTVPVQNYFGIYDKCAGMVFEKKEEAMFFFDSPWSCIRGLTFLSGNGHSDKVARILEYDIPDEIVNVSKNVFTNYENWQADGKLIPIALLQKGNPICADYPENLKSKLDSITLSEAKPVLSILTEKYCNESYDELQSRVIRVLPRINQRRIQEFKGCFETGFITGKSIVITKDDMFTLADVMFGEKPVEDLAEIMKRSNGILTSENLTEYNYDSQGYQYGIQITYH